MMKVYFDDQHFLREAVTDKKQLQQKIAEYEQQFSHAQNLEQYRIASILGYYHRLYSTYSPTDLVIAEDYFHFCLDYARSINDVKKELVTLVRLGETYKYRESYALALRIFTEALTLCHTYQMDSYHDFILQHIGKCYMEVGFYDKAKQYFEQALRLRKQKRNTKLIAATKQAMLLNQQLEATRIEHF